MSDHRQRHLYHYPRSMREVFGHDLAPLPGRVRFGNCHRGCRLAIAITAVLVAVLILVLAR